MPSRRELWSCRRWLAVDEEMPLYAGACLRRALASRFMEGSGPTGHRSVSILRWCIVHGIEFMVYGILWNIMYGKSL